MARLQILELPEGTSDDRPPFILVIDQWDVDTLEATTMLTEYWDAFGKKIGARGVLFCDRTINIPANDTTAYLGSGGMKTEIDLKLGDQDVREAIAADMQKMREANEDRILDRRQARIDAQRLADERTDIALRQERDEQAAELERLHAGEEPVTDTRVTPTPAQWIWQWNRATPEKRLDMAKQILDAMPRADNCFMADHEAQIAHLCGEVARLGGEPTKPDA